MVRARGIRVGVVPAGGSRARLIPAGGSRDGWGPARGFLVPGPLTVPRRVGASGAPTGSAPARRLPPRLRGGQPSDFNIRDTAELSNAAVATSQLMSALLLAVALISLVVGGVGIMNIMLVSVTERTKEIGLVKAIGGRQRNVRQQFLFESVLISLIGAGFGVVLGVLLGNVVSLLMATGFIVPWTWIVRDSCSRTCLVSYSGTGTG